MAIVSIDGEHYTLHPGESAAGVELMSANSDEAVLKVGGEINRYSLGSSAGFSPSEDDNPSEKAVVIAQDSGGMYRVDGEIDHQPWHFLVDTGASTVVLSSVDAKKLNINYRHGQLGRVSTASGQTMAYNINLAHLRIGSIDLYNVSTLVIEGNSPEVTLLGMSALSQLNMEHKGSVLYLRKKY
jgi:aspartyl protease family protein